MVVNHHKRSVQSQVKNSATLVSFGIVGFPMLCTHLAFRPDNVGKLGLAESGEGPFVYT